MMQNVCQNMILTRNQNQCQRTKLKGAGSYPREICVKSILSVPIIIWTFKTKQNVKQDKISNRTKFQTGQNFKQGKSSNRTNTSTTIKLLLSASVLYKDGNITDNLDTL